MTPGGVVSFRRNSLPKWLINGKTHRMGEFPVVVLSLRFKQEAW